MGNQRPPRRSALLLFALLAVAALFWLPGPVESPAAADEPLRAESVCDAQELKARQAEDPHLQIEIPPEFDRPFPTLAACRSHEAAWDPEAPGPNQPIPFSHKHHAGDFEIECMYCHTGTDRSRAAGVPSVEVCMGCHEQFPKEYDELEGIQVLKQHWEEQSSIPWVQIHRLPEHVKFQHQAHVRAGFECQTCHGQVEEMDKLYLTPDTRWWQYGLPTQKLEMGWCVMCHRDNGASQDCLTCHY
jgi:hypothetical protein